MPIIPISEIDNPRLDAYRSLKQTNQTRGKQIFIAEGEKLVERLLASPLTVESILASQSHVERLVGRVPDDVPVYLITTQAVNELVCFHFHRGLLACGRRPENPSFTDLWPDRSQPLTLVLCPDIKDPENLGAILRISAAFGVDGVIVGDAGTDPYSRRVLRVSMGTVFRLPVIQTDDWPAMLSTLQQAGVETVASVLDPQAERLTSANRSVRFALALGSEGPGLSADFVNQCDRRVTIPMADGVDS